MMSTSGKTASEETLGESWVVCPTPGDRITPLPFGSGEDYMRLLRDAQRDSTHSSARHSLASSRRDTPRDSPKSPPNSPNTELATEDELKDVYINYTFQYKDADLDKDWIYEWNTKPEPAGPKDWKLKQALGISRRKTYSVRNYKVGKNGLFSKEVLYTLLLTNILSLLIGTGIGFWLTRRGLLLSRVTIE